MTLDPDLSVNSLDPKFRSRPIRLLNFGVSLVLDLCVKPTHNQGLNNAYGIRLQGTANPSQTWTKSLMGDGLKNHNTNVSCTIVIVLVFFAGKKM